MMRLLLATILLFSFQSKTSQPTIEISTVDMGTLTKFRLDCDKFDDAFKNEKKVKTLKGQKAVERFLNELKNLKKSDDSRETDTRAQILIKYQDHVDKFCADRFSVCHNGTCYLITDKLKRIIW